MKKKNIVLTFLLTFCLFLFTGCTTPAFVDYNISAYEEVVITNENIELDKTPLKADIAEAYQKITMSIYTVAIDSDSIQSFGSGVIVYSGGYIATNYHVVSEVVLNPTNFKLEVSALGDDESYSAQVLWYDRNLDTAIIQCNQYAKLPSAKLMDRNVFADENSKLRVTDEVIAIGTPLEIDLEGTVTVGTCSFVNRDQVSLSVAGNNVLDYNWYHYLIQHTAEINHGNSGGPLIDSNGYVIGLNTLGRDKAGEQGIFFAVPIYPITRALDKVVMNYEVYQKPTSNVLFGVTGGDSFDAQLLNSDKTDENDLKVNGKNFEQDGWLIRNVDSSSWLFDILENNDIITKITIGAKTYNIKNTYDFVFARIDLFYVPNGTITVIRDGNEMSFDFNYNDEILEV